MEFNKAYNRQEFIGFLKNRFLPEDFVQTEENVEFVTQTKYSTQAVKLGTCESLDLVVYEIRHTSKNDARVSLSKEAFRLLTDEMEDRALVAFVPEDNDATYRFSFIEISLNIDEEHSRITRSYSNPRRYSYLLGEGISYYTPNKYLNEKGRVVDDEDLHSRFSVEVLTKDFYRELSIWYACAIKIIKFPNNLKDPTDETKYNNESAIRLITRLIFVWFLKQRHLIPEEFFDEQYIADNLIDGFNPNVKQDLFSKSYESKYYKAILQNLFFAMLNCPITEGGNSGLTRRFSNGRTDYDNNKLMRYKDYFINPQLFIDIANRTVPFLNGGLFDCLDDKDNGLYYDGFSDREIVRKTLIVPDFLFFGESVGKDLDLSGWFGDKSMKKVDAQGILLILKRYNFTVEENTPFDKEVSLDPELLGKAFENLLAEYNPETQTTARKQTGSFYTPREIVQYMVDESLVAHLKRTVGEDLETEYRKLLQYTDEPFELNEEQRHAIMQSLYNCKILDPACGSGAFPMGILQQMVHILQRIDPKNENWKEMMLNLAVGETKEAFMSNISEERLELLKDIERSFDENINRPDYARKLYLIENCIYGVDIQPIAIQISKLRFFISLVVDQKTNDNPTDNFGIRPLPNLEAKFVAANTLIGLDKIDASLFDTDEVKEKEEEMKEARHKIFGAKTVKTKRKYRQRIAEIRQELSALLEELGAVGNDGAKQLNSWDMFDQNASSPFFDPEWMFGVKEGFDIVIANPPYVQVNTKDKHLYSSYPAVEGRIDLYELFIQKGIMLLCYEGTLTYINPNTILSNLYSQQLRKLLISKYGLCEISNFGMNVFDTPIVHTCILRMNKGHIVQKIGIKKSIRKINDINCTFDYYLSVDEIEKTKNYTFDITLNSTERVLFNKLNSHKTLGDYCYIRQCIKTGNDTEFVKRSDIVLSSPWKSCLRGKSIDKYCIKDNSLYLKYGNWLARNWANKSFYERPKIAIREAGKYITACLDTNNKYLLSSLYSVYPKYDYNEYQLKCLLGFLNCKLATFYVTKVAFDLTEGAFTKMRTNQLARLPLIASLLTGRNNTIVTFVDEILRKKSLSYNEDTSILEDRLDILFYRLYGLTYDEVLIVDPACPITEEEYNNERERNE